MVLRHALRTAAPPVVTAIGLQLGVLFSGAVLTETIFSWPGVGQLVVERVLNRDYPAVQGVVLAVALLFIGINLLADIGARAAGSSDAPCVSSRPGIGPGRACCAAAAGWSGWPSC